MATQHFGTGESNADIFINQARNRIMDPKVDREPNDDVLLVLGQTNALLKGLTTQISVLVDHLPTNHNGRMARAKQLGIPAISGAGVVAVLAALVQLVGG